MPYRTCFRKDISPFHRSIFWGKLQRVLSKEDDLKEQRGKIKKRTYIKEEQLSAVLNHPGSCCDLYPYIWEFSGQQLRASMEREDQGIEGLEKKLFTVPVTILRKINTADEKEDSAETVSEFCFYLQGDSDPAVTAIVDTAEQMKRREGL